MQTYEVSQTTPENSQAARQGGAGPDRRGFLRQAAAVGMAGAGLAAWFVAASNAGAGTQEAAYANAPAVENIMGTYLFNDNLFQLTLTIDSQNGNSFSGFVTEQGVNTPISGTVTGSLSTGSAHPVTVVFNRLLTSGVVQTYTGAYARIPTVMFLAGVFYHDGVGPYPWAAERTLIA